MKLGYTSFVVQFVLEFLSERVYKNESAFLYISSGRKVNNFYRQIYAQFLILFLSSVLSNKNTPNSAYGSIFSL